MRQYFCTSATNDTSRRSTSCIGNPRFRLVAENQIMPNYHIELGFEPAAEGISAANFDGPIY